ncbi:branched-chain amino acid ABC transporter substrate-binding protein [Candidatus Chlorohelix sp.]|uniref:branched-chain amino acid ABC transporter substrate-binding protein n=1 Tax=Candidatus Chlorohelix sp. TaxID=3139201 RepID=UPI003057FD65
MNTVTKKFRLLALLVVSFTVMALLAACGDNTATPVPATTARIYSSLPLTGSSKAQAETLVNAAKLALDDFTGGTGKIGNFTIDYVSLDDATAAKGQWDADQEKANANKALNDPDTMIYLGTFNSGAAKVSIPLLNPANITMISPANTYPGLTRAAKGVTEQGEPDVYYPAKTRNYFRVITADDVQGPADVEFIKSLNAKTVFVIDDSQAYGKGVADAVAAACTSAGLDCSNRASITGKETDYKSLAATVKSKNPDAIFFGGITQQQAGKLVADIRAAGIKAPFIGPDGINEEAFIKDGGAAAEGVYSSIGGTTEDKLPAKGQDFLKRYKAKYGNVEAYTIYGYEMMSVALSAIKTAGVKDRKAILAAVAATKDFDGVLGKWSFDKNGDTTLTDFRIDQVKDGKWVTFTVVKPKFTAGS